MQMKIRFATACFAVFVAASAYGQTPFVATLTHDQETTRGEFVTSGPNPVARPQSFGNAVFVLNQAQTQLSFTANVFNIDVTGTQTPNDTNDNLQAAHIHVGSGMGFNAPVRWGFFGTPDNDTAPKQLVVTPFTTGVGGTFSSIWDVGEGNAGTTLTSNLPEILAGRSYINFHTTQFGGGEIRGQIFLPEPSAAGALCIALLGLTSRRFGRRPR